MHTCKSIKDNKLTDAYDKLWILIAEAYREHRYLMTSTKLHADDKEAYEIILKRKVDNKSLLESSLKELTRFLYLHHGVKPWLLIDEYDTPIQSGYLYDYYSEIVQLMRGLLGAALMDLALIVSIVNGIAQ